MSSTNNITSLSELENILDGESAWRKKELFQCLTNVQATEGSAQRLALRGAIALLYAHWEGWIKAGSRSYLAFVNSQRIPLSEMSPALMGAGLKTRLQELEVTHKSDLHTKFARFIMSEDFDKPLEISLNLIRSDSNLSDKLFDEIVTRIGADRTWYELRFPLIEELRKRRNGVAHGDRLIVDPGTYHQLHNGILEICVQFDSELRRQAHNKSYLRHTLSS